MTWSIAVIPWLIISILIAVTLDFVVVGKHAWQPPPMYVRVIFGIFWPAIAVGLAISALFGKRDIDVDLDD